LRTKLTLFGAKCLFGFVVKNNLRRLLIVLWIIPVLPMMHRRIKVNLTSSLRIVRSAGSGSQGAFKKKSGPALAPQAGGPAARTQASGGKSGEYGNRRAMIGRYIVHLPVLGRRPFSLARKNSCYFHANMALRQNVRGKAPAISRRPATAKMRKCHEVLNR
jgi:hypothetical protein